MGGDNGLGGHRSDEDVFALERSVAKDEPIVNRLSRNITHPILVDDAGSRADGIDYKAKYESAQALIETLSTNLIDARFIARERAQTIMDLQAKLKEERDMRNNYE